MRGRALNSLQLSQLQATGCFVLSHGQAVRARCCCAAIWYFWWRIPEAVSLTQVAPAPEGPPGLVLADLAALPPVEPIANTLAIELGQVCTPGKLSSVGNVASAGTAPCDSRIIALRSFMHKDCEQQPGRKTGVAAART